MIYPLDLKCSTCGRRKGNHSAKILACPIGRIQTFQQFSAKTVFSPRLPILPPTVRRKLLQFEALIVDPNMSPDRAATVEHARYQLWASIADQLNPKPKLKFYL